MALDVRSITNGIVSPLLASGLFARVNRHEPKTAPGSGLTAGVWFMNILPDEGDSGLDATSACVVFIVRLYTSMLSEPQDQIDDDMLDAVSQVIGLFAGGFELGGSVKNVDIFGAGGGGKLSAVSGYINQDSRLMRVVDITLPLIISDVWDQAP